jgi:hypothetical protein
MTRIAHYVACASFAADAAANYLVSAAKLIAESDGDTPEACAYALNLLDEAKRIVDRAEKYRSTSETLLAAAIVLGEDVDAEPNELL